MVRGKNRSKRTSSCVKQEDATYQAWRHPGGKLLRLGPDQLSDSELLSILIGTGVKGKSAENIAQEIMERFGSFRGLANQPIEKLESLRGLGQVKTVRIAAAFEIARRIVQEVKGKR